MLYSEQKTRTYKGSKASLILRSSQTYIYDEKGNVKDRGIVCYTLENDYDTIDLNEKDFADLCEIIMNLGNVNAD